MKYKSVFDIIGPVMIGPSSSHTAGAARIGLVTRELFGRQPEWARIHLYGSFAETYKGHGTDVAIVGGLLGFDTFDDRIRTAFELADAAGLRYEFIPESGNTEHPNTARVVIGDGQSEMELIGISIGGGKIEISELNGFPLRLSGNHSAILVVHEDQPGSIAKVATCLADQNINIGHMEVSRKEQGKMALMVIEVDDPIEESILEQIAMLPHIQQVTRIAE
ncbi:L-serine ammonia-lyase, iron-sulfur-dependent subunit beta [Paenisporosarcina cavernae]|uniref:L-serine deaminase n=1 Tax=Paenisporosarcina cavernae TaxID=2320858 RepID=A0A385YR11_9BACL|nr:L-serine ammonia-lyase, iron-sulfur-dependent subunit beta [Paenisporosarcina cavernae]AYC29205.1 L-serine ammonia-lyase, iron-sulfur-dependent, subunit beta [Paenisporosarcina cavernae]